MLHTAIIQAWIAELVAHRLGTKEVVGSNPGKGEDYSDPNLNLIMSLYKSSFVSG